jgi:putative ABC transport system permease protein
VSRGRYSQWFVCGSAGPEDLAPDLPIADLRTTNQSLAGMFGHLIFRVGAIQATGMGVLGLTLALIGVYGVVSFGASLRTREIGTRVP